VHGDGFLDEHVEAGFKGGNAEGGVSEVGRGDEDGVDALGREEFLRRGKAAEFREFLQIGVDGVARGDELATGDFAGEEVFGVGLAMPPKPMIPRRILSM